MARVFMIDEPGPIGTFTRQFWEVSYSEIPDNSKTKLFNSLLNNEEAFHHCHEVVKVDPWQLIMNPNLEDTMGWKEKEDTLFCCWPSRLPLPFMFRQNWLNSSLVGDNLDNVLIFDILPIELHNLLECIPPGTRASISASLHRTPEAKMISIDLAHLEKHPLSRVFEKLLMQFFCNATEIELEEVSKTTSEVAIVEVKRGEAHETLFAKFGPPGELETEWWNCNRIALAYDNDQRFLTSPYLSDTGRLIAQSSSDFCGLFVIKHVPNWLGGYNTRDLGHILHVLPVQQGDVLVDIVAEGLEKFHGSCIKENHDYGSIYDLFLPPEQILEVKQFAPTTTHIQPFPCIAINEDLLKMLKSQGLPDEALRKLEKRISSGASLVPQTEFWRIIEKDKEDKEDKLMKIKPAILEKANISEKYRIDCARLEPPKSEIRRTLTDHTENWVLNLRLERKLLELTGPSLSKLKESGVSNDTLGKLSNMQEQDYETTERFLSASEASIGKQQNAKTWQQILQQAPSRPLCKWLRLMNTDLKELLLSSDEKGIRTGGEIYLPRNSESYADLDLINRKNELLRAFHEYGLELDSFRFSNHDELKPSKADLLRSISCCDGLLKQKADFALGQRIHGDLHCKNILVPDPEKVVDTGSGSNDQFVIIDFAAVQEHMPISWDFVKLELSFRLDWFLHESRHNMLSSVGDNLGDLVAWFFCFEEGPAYSPSRKKGWNGRPERFKTVRFDKGARILAKRIRKIRELWRNRAKECGLNEQNKDYFASLYFAALATFAAPVPFPYNDKQGRHARKYNWMRAAWTLVVASNALDILEEAGVPVEEEEL